MFAITSVGGVIRTRAGEVKQSGRQTMGVRLMNLASGDSVVALARNAESAESVDEVVGEPVDGPVDEACGRGLWMSLWMKLPATKSAIKATSRRVAASEV